MKVKKGKSYLRFFVFRISYSSSCWKLGWWKERREWKRGGEVLHRGSAFVHIYYYGQRQALCGLVFACNRTFWCWWQRNAPNNLPPWQPCVTTANDRESCVHCPYVHLCGHWIWLMSARKRTDTRRNGRGSELRRLFLEIEFVVKFSVCLIEFKTNDNFQKFRVCAYFKSATSIL